MPSRHEYHPWRWLVGGLVAVVVVLLAAFGIAVAKASSIAAYVIERALPGLEAKTGRKIAIEGVHVRVFPRPRAEVSHFTVAGAVNEPPLVDAARMSGTVALWSARLGARRRASRAASAAGAGPSPSPQQRDADRESVDATRKGD